MNQTDAFPAAPRPADILKFAEIWRPTWMGGSPAFWRELVPDGASMRGEVGRLRFTAGPWRRMDDDFARKVAALPNSYFTLDDHPGVTFCVRRFKDKHASPEDRAAIRVLWVCGNPPLLAPEPHADCDCSQCLPPTY